jgi:undecaprenyl diphosphate synthase
MIMDGNGRWAKKRGLPRSAGHKEGAKTLQKIVKSVADMGIKYLTVYAFSTENWRRDKEEVSYLMNLLREYLDNDIKTIQEQGGRIRFIGERNMLDADIIAKINEVEKQTAENDKFTFCIALSYGSRAEIISAAQRAAKAVSQGEISIEDIDEKNFSKFLYTSDIPDPDILIRTSGEQRISNYLLWQIAYSELFFTPTLWPDFSEAELRGIINDFNSRERRYGKV